MKYARDRNRIVAIAEIRTGRTCLRSGEAASRREGDACVINETNKAVRTRGNSLNLIGRE